MRKTKEKISFDLDWQLRKEARTLNLTVDQLIRKIYEEWKKSQPFSSFSSKYSIPGIITQQTKEGSSKKKDGDFKS